jgi:serine/threonine protein kinase/tetratricopeptide (TPR) repeat protein
MGEVFRAEDERLGRTVALKFLSPELTTDSDARARFAQEARTASALDHHNICAIYDIGETEDGRLFIAMAHYGGVTFRERMSSGPLEVSEVLDIATQVASGLARAHGSGIVHRDLKPSNLLITSEGEVKLLDFGIAKLSGTEGLTGTGTTPGTVGYMAPEQIEGRAVDGQADIWALGVVLYEALVGERPFGGGSATERLASVLAIDPIPPAERRPGIPLAVSDLVMQMLEKDPARRPPNAAAVISRIKALTTTSHAVSAAPRRTRSIRRWASTGVAVAGVASGVYWLAGRDTPIDSIAVLPFENVSTTDEGEYLSYGLTTSLVDRLSRFKGLRVVPRGVASAYPSATSDLREVARTLNVRALVTGRVGEVEGRLVVRAELTDVGKMSQMWGAQYDRPLTDILVIQDSLVREIADNLRLELTAVDQQSLAMRPTQSPEAYRLFLLSRFHNLSVTPEGVALGREYANEAIALDSGYARGWAALSDSYLTHVFLDLESPAEGYAKALHAAERAVALDGGLAAAHAVLGYVRHHGEWDWEGALEDWERATRLDPSNADAWQGLSEGHLTLGRLNEAVAAAERALEVDPLTPIISAWLGNVYAFAGRFDDALLTLGRARELEPDNVVALFGTARTLSEMGRHDDAIQAQVAALETFGIDAGTSPRLAHMLAVAGREVEAHEILVRMPSEHGDYAGEAIAWGRLGEFDRAFAALGRAIARRESGLWWIKLDRGFDPLRTDSRFSEGLRAMGLPD